MVNEQRAIFVSVGATATDAQEHFVSAVEDRLRSEGLTPHTIGRNTFSSDAPLKAVSELLTVCSGAVVIAFERSYFPSGISKRGGPKEVVLKGIKLPTSWNQIEAAMAYSHGLPLLVIVEAGLRSEGLLERGYDWYVQELTLEPAALASIEFNGVFASWKQKISQRELSGQDAARQDKAKTAQDLTIAELVGGLKLAQLWSVLAALAVLVAGAFAAGARLFTK